MKRYKIIMFISIALFLVLSVFDVYMINKSLKTNKELENVKYELIRIHNEVVGEIENIPDDISIILEDNTKLQNYKPTSWIKEYYDKSGNRINKETRQQINNTDFTRDQVEHIVN